ncbi:hypothetical protein BC832DRAFT_428479 [Gaertneriomyces semiglobifer]|nr:hypothetical protein BC832DRAFT_428479 [Gaertneriomyces semiglobifer]
MFVAHTGLATVMSDPYREEDIPAGNPDAAVDFSATNSTSNESNESNARPFEDLRQHLELWRTPSDTLYDPSTVVSPLNANDVLETVQQKESELRLAAELGLSLLEKCQAQEAEITELETRLRGYQENERMYYDDKVFAVESELRRMETENGELKSQITVLESKLTRTTRERDKQQKDLQTALTQMEHHVEDLEVAHDVQAELRKENHRLQARLASLQHDTVPPSLPSPMGASQPQTVPTHHSEQQHQQDMALLLSFLSELQASNAKLKSELSNGENLRETNLRLNAELAEVRALLAEARNDLAFLQSENGSEPASSPDDLLVLSPRKSLVHELEEVIRKSPSQSSIDGAHKGRSQATAAGASGPYPNSIPKSMSDSGQQHPLSRAKSKSISLPNVSSCPTPLLTHFRKLTVLSDSLHNRLSQTDPQSLNRKFRRSFEIRELSKLSQSVIESVQMDVQEMGLRFPSRLSSSGDMRFSPQSEMSHSRDPTTNVDPIDVHKSRSATTVTGLATTQGESRGNTTTDSTATESSLYYLLFLPLLHLIQRLLLDICKQRITNNDYVLAYYEKIIERSQTTETTRIASSPAQKDAPSVAATVRTVKHTKSFGSLGSFVNTERVVGWFSPVRNRKPSSPNGASVSASGEK